MRLARPGIAPPRNANGYSHIRPAVHDRVRHHAATELGLGHVGRGSAFFGPAPAGQHPDLLAFHDGERANTAVGAQGPPTVVATCRGDEDSSAIRLARSYLVSLACSLTSNRPSLDRRTRSRIDEPAM